MKKNTEKTYQELLIEELEALILKKSMEIKEIELIMEKNAKKTHQELLIDKLESMKLKKSLEIDEINQLINKLKTK